MEGNSLNSYLNLCKIFDMRIKLDKEKNVKTSIEVFDNYEKYCRKIDNIYNSEFQKELKPLISPASTLEKEKDRLRRLIKLLDERLEKRNELEDRYYETTGKQIYGLQMIVSEEELQDKKDRLSVVSKYLDTKEEIDNVTESISKLKTSLKEEEGKKEEYESKNKIMEDELYSSFMSIINKDEYYKSIHDAEITIELDKIRSNVTETKETLDITRESIGSLVGNGMDDDYTSYIEEAEKSYYNFKNKEIILSIYKLVVDFENDFKLICGKREKISDLLLEKKELSDSLIINVDNELEAFESILLLQNGILEAEREIIDNIANYTSRINFKEERLEELNEVNKSVEVLAILREYGLIDTYDSDNLVNDEFVDMSSENVEKNENIISSMSVNSIPLFENSSFDLPIEEVSVENNIPVIEEVYDPYRIVEIIDYPKTLNVGLAKLKGESVREKVNKKLNPVIEETKVENEKNELPSEKDDTFIDNIINQVEETVEDKVEFTSISEEKKEDIIETPVWTLPTDLDVNSENSDENVSSLPVWDSISPVFEESKQGEDVKEIDSIDIVSKPDENSDNLFWIPVSESKLESSSFPSLNLPNKNINKNSEFVFPNINS